MGETSPDLSEYKRIARHLRAKVFSKTNHDLLEYERITRHLRATILALLLRRWVRNLRRLSRWILAAAAGLARRSMVAFVRARRRGATIRALWALDERTLQDIGVARGDIYAIAEDFAARRGNSRVEHTPEPRLAALTNEDASSTATVEDEIRPAA